MPQSSPLAARAHASARKLAPFVLTSRVSSETGQKTLLDIAAVLQGSRKKHLLDPRGMAEEPKPTARANIEQHALWKRARAMAGEWVCPDACRPIRQVTHSPDYFKRRRTC